MTMKIIFLKDYGDYKAGHEGFIPRSLGRTLCQQEITAPWCKKDKISSAEIEAKAKKEKAEKKEKKKAEDKAKAEKLLKEKEEKARETADSEPAKTRSKSITK